LERELFGDRHFPLCRILATQPSGISETEFPPLPNLCALAMKSM
jgi:hypothetical protein